MKILDDIKETRSMVETINDELSAIKNELLPKTAHKAVEYDKVMDELKNVRIYVDKAIPYIDEYGNKCMKVTYKVDPSIIHIGNDGKVEKNYAFHAMNYLNIIDKNDQIKMAQLLERIKKSTK